MEHGMQDTPAKVPGAEAAPPEKTLGVSHERQGTGPLSELFGADSMTVTQVNLTKKSPVKGGPETPGV